MIRPRGPSVFLERRIYRMRRKLDALRLMPLLAAILFLIPLFIQPDFGAASGATSRVMIYVFLVWAGLIVMLGALLHQLRPYLRSGGLDLPLEAQMASPASEKERAPF